MDEPERTQKLEGSQEERNKIDDSEQEAVNEETPDAVKETHEHDQEKSATELVSEDLDEEGMVSMESVTEREPPVLPFSEESADAAKDPVEETLQNKTEQEQPLDETSAFFPAVEDSVSKDMDSLRDQNGVPPILLNAEPKPTEEAKIPDSEENHGESSRAVDLASSDIPQAPESTENEKAYIALTPRPLQRTSWQGCCGLFELLRGSNR